MSARTIFGNWRCRRCAIESSSTSMHMPTAARKTTSCSRFSTPWRRLNDVLPLSLNAIPLIQLRQWTDCWHARSRLRPIRGLQPSRVAVIPLGCATGINSHAPHCQCVAAAIANSMAGFSGIGGLASRNATPDTFSASLSLRVLDPAKITGKSLGSLDASALRIQ